MNTPIGKIEWQFVTGKLEASGYTPPNPDYEYAGTKLWAPKIINSWWVIVRLEKLLNTELNESIIKLRGRWQTLKSNVVHCEPFILPTFSVSHLLNRPELKKYAWEDMKLLRDKIKET